MSDNGLARPALAGKEIQMLSLLTLVVGFMLGVWTKKTFDNLSARLMGSVSGTARQWAQPAASAQAAATDREACPKCDGVGWVTKAACAEGGSQ